MNRSLLIRLNQSLKIGDWIVYNDNLYHIGNIALQEYYECLRADGTVHTFSLDIDSKSHLWTIQDAKDCDILAIDYGVCIFDGTLEEGKYPFAYCGITKRGFESYDGKIPFSHDNNIHPATKEQRDTLFDKIGEAGYWWDAKKKELKKVEQTPADKKESLTDIEKSILNFADYFYSNRCKPESEWVDEIKMLRDYIPSHILKPTEWSEEDEANLVRTLAFIRNTSLKDVDEIKESVLTWITSLKDRVQLQPKQRWSEENEEMIDETLYFIREYQQSNRCKDEAGMQNSVSCEKWLKSLKERYTWKPSDEHVRALNYVVNLMASSESPKENDYYYNAFKDLREQLKKLKE